MKRRLSLFHVLFRSLCSSGWPVLLTFDDLQWADETSLNSLRLMVMDPDTSYVHYIASYRDDQVEPKRRVTAIIDDIDAQGVNVTRIKLGTMQSTLIFVLVLTKIISTFL